MFFELYSSVGTSIEVPTGKWQGTRVGCMNRYKKTSPCVTHGEVEGCSFNYLIDLIQEMGKPIVLVLLPLVLQYIQHMLSPLDNFLTENE